MIASQECINFLKGKESFSSTPYLCPAKVPTIGYGHTKGVTLNSAPISKEQGEKLLRQDLARAEFVVNTNIKVKLTQNQFDALVSLAFNIESPITLPEEKSTLKRMLNSGDYAGAADQFLRWKKITLPNKTKVDSNGLAIRRAEERAMFLKG